jgi:hypothetical protein
MNPSLEGFELFRILLRNPGRLADGEEGVADVVDSPLAGLTPFQGQALIILEVKSISFSSSARDS